MAEFKKKKPSARFVIPDKLTVRQQLDYLSAVSLKPGIDWLGLWQGAVLLIQEFECELIPSVEKLDLDKVTDPQITNVLVWVGWEVKRHMDKLEEVEKNS